MRWSGSATPEILPRCSNQGGFALALVVFLLFAIAMLGTAGYQVLRTEAFQSQQAAEFAQALSVADGGLRWFLGSQRGLVPDSTSFDLNGGSAVITTRKIRTLSPEEDLYLITSEGIYTDPRYPQAPARRRVSHYAVHRKVPLRNLAPLMTTADTVRVQDYARVYAQDQASFGECAGAPAGTLAGVVARQAVTASSGGYIAGSPIALTPGSFQAVTDTVRFDWSIYSDPSYPVDFDGFVPSFWSLPSDTFPVIRVNGNFTPNWLRQGRGVLIVTGKLTIPPLSFWQWDGIVVAREMADVDDWGWFWIYGTLVTGLGSPLGTLTLERGNLYAHSCNVEKAGLALSRLVPREGSWWEVF